MDIFISKKMRNFILLAQTNNIARAAEKIHMTASPFGKSIAALEEQIGYTLFTRKDNNISLNGNDSNLLIVFYVQIMPDDFVMQLHRF
ncbi:LysR family transcriptional regulator [Escherichia coli]